MCLAAAIALVIGVSVSAMAADPGGASNVALQEAIRQSRSATPELGWARFQRLQSDYPGLPARTIAILQQRLKTQPADADGWFQLGLLQVVSGAPSEAAASFAKAAQLRPIDPYGYAYQGYALVEAGNPQAAMAPLQAALKRDPQHRFATWVLGQAYYRQGMRHQAAKVLLPAAHHP